MAQWANVPDVTFNNGIHTMSNECVLLLQAALSPPHQSHGTSPTLTNGYSDNDNDNK